MRAIFVATLGLAFLTVPFITRSSTAAPNTSESAEAKKLAEEAKRAAEDAEELKRMIGVPPGASVETVKAQFRRDMAQYDPKRLGGVSAISVRDPGALQAAQFAILGQQQAMKNKGDRNEISLVEIVRATRQVVSGMKYSLSLKIKVGDVPRTADAEVWVRPWLKAPDNYKVVSWKLTDKPPLKPQNTTTAVKSTLGGRPLTYTTYEAPYFVNGTFEPEAKQAFAVLKSMDEFERVFGVGTVMGGKRPGVSAKTFESSIIVTAIHRGPLSRYKVESVACKVNDLEVRYQWKTDLASTAEYTEPLILAVPKGHYNSIKFIENGKEIKVLK